MEILVICLVSAVVAFLTLFSGFGLGTLMLPVFALFFPVPVAIAMTAVVHLANNLFKLGLFFRSVDVKTAFQFGLPAFLTAFAGAALLIVLTQQGFSFEYQWQGREFQVTAVKLVIACLIIFFLLADLLKLFDKVSVKGKHLVMGGLLSGFFGGLSGHQGAFRSAFLIKSGLSKHAFIATGVVIATVVDLGRLVVYGPNFFFNTFKANGLLVGAACLSAFIGSFIAARIFNKITIPFLHRWIAFMLLLIALGLGLGVI